VGCVSQQQLNAAYQLLPHGPALRAIDAISALHARVIDCTVAPQPNHVLHPQSGPISSFTCVEYAAQAAALHGILMGAEYDPLKPAFIGAVKDVRLLTSSYTCGQTIRLKAEQEYCERDGAIYSFSAWAEDEALITGRLILKK
jgi:predicted hotdog family 3-hydroxylacyl-ACP dehydratase